jgi:hypothetical protein
MKRRRSLVLALFALTLLAAACGGDSPLDTPAGDVEVGEDGVTVEGPSGGEVNIGTGDLPEGWPSDFPIPDGATPAYSVAAGGGVSVWFASDQSTDELTSFFSTALPAAGYTIDSQTDFSDATGDYSIISVSGNGSTGGIYLGAGAAGAAPGFEGEFSYFVTLTPTA